MRTFLKDILYNWQCGKDVRPTGVGCQMSDDFTGLFPRQPVIHGPVEVIRDLVPTGRKQSARSQSRDSDRAEQGPDVTKGCGTKRPSCIAPVHTENSIQPFSTQCNTVTS